jgi:hypothetical protein
MNLGIVPVAEASIQSLMNSISKVIIDPLIVLLFSIAVVYFIYGLAQYLLSPDNEEVRKASKAHMLWGVIGMFIMVGAYGIINIIINTISQ